MRAAEEYKQERTTEINVGAVEETEVTESGEITNPNDELPVTYLFYELQRRYRVTERIQQLIPVVLVAQEVPEPHEIDDDWLISYDWILRRSILDDSFLPALAYLSSGSVGEEYSLEQLRQNVELQRSVVDALRQQVVELHESTEARYLALEREIERRAELIASGAEGDSLLGKLVDPILGSLFFGGDDGDPKAAAQIREDAAKDAAERAAREENDLRGRLTREVTALNSATEEYSRQVSNYLNRRAQVDRLRVHVKQNIFYYLQAIWSYEPSDQRFFRLHEVPVPDLRGSTRTYTIAPASQARAVLPAGTATYQFALRTNLPPPTQFIPLAQAADLDNLLGFKGNYMVFPLLRQNDLIDFMEKPYVDPLMGLADPDDSGNWSLDSFADFVCCLKQHLSSEEWTEMLPWLRQQYKALLESPLRQHEEVIVPTDSIFIEDLPGTHPILEDFKLLHRAIDVKQVQAQVRHTELENVRIAVRLLAGEREDPDIEKQIVITGDPAGIVVADGT